MDCQANEKICCRWFLEDIVFHEPGALRAFAPTSNANSSSTHLYPQGGWRCGSLSKSFCAGGDRNTPDG